MEPLVERNLRLDQELTKASREELLSLLNSQVDYPEDDGGNDRIRELLEDEFPVPKQGSSIVGTHEIISLFLEITEKKYDFDYNLNEITINNFIKRGRGKDEISLSFDMNQANHVNNVITMYDARKDFLDMNFRINIYALFALFHGLNDFILEHIRELQTELPETVRDNRQRYRMIDSVDAEGKSHSYLRAVVSTRYKFYDNYAVLYMALIALEHYIKESKTAMEVSQFNVTDSKMMLYIVEREPYPISEDLYLKLGVRVSNSELGDGAALVNIVYQIYDDQGHKITVLGQELTKIKHNNKASTIHEGLTKLNELGSHRKDIIKVISRLNMSKKLTDEEFNETIELIMHMRRQKLLTDDVKKQLDEYRKDFKAQDVVNLLTVFNHLGEIIRKSSLDSEIVVEARLTKLMDKIIDRMSNSNR